ncbi:MAG: hypothetical protein SH820_17285, partial [Xanthomonadales bacterium]|nr:hypothetical protein [Xanthomonadales bacterium]
MNPASRKLQQLVDEIIGPPSPTVPGANMDFYDDISRLRFSGATTCCAEFLSATRERFGFAAADDIRDDLRPIRERLATAFPDYSALLADPA